MFSGIVEGLGTVRRIEKKKNLFVLTVAAKKISKSTRIGESISVEGVCLTVSRREGHSLIFDIIKETIEKTTLKYLKQNQKVNLERSLRADGRIGGHFVLGHVDGIGIIQKKVTKENSVEFQISLKGPMAPYLVSKGSVSVDGISLTIGEVRAKYFSVYIIPHTLKITTLGTKGPGDKVNIETDILAKYILKQK